MKIRPAAGSLIQKTYQDKNPVPEKGFGEILKKMVADVDSLQARSSATAGAAISGQPVEVHNVMIAMEEARMAFDLMLEVRNKLVEAYRELMQMRM
ncbi:MAG: flagellar hook-basal body complex protein FliE [Candidatus Krumholzibacteriota bacterium]|nr:flagellar hook-basal body complex protein FliE [Candidatus Krumholzibacteriota bacterium]